MPAALFIYQPRTPFEHAGRPDLWLGGVTLLGDGEFDGTELQVALRTLQWHYVCRTTPTIGMTVYGRIYPGDPAPTRGELLAVRPAWMTAQRCGPVSILDAFGFSRLCVSVRSSSLVIR